MERDYQFYRSIADHIDAVTGGFRPEIGLILGTGLGGFADMIGPCEGFERCEIPYAEIPGFLTSTAPGHQGKLIFGQACGRKVVCMSGRFHYYEGYSYEELAMPVRVLALLGIKKLVVTNAAGAVNESYRPGEVMVIRDHIKLFGGSPMRGPNVPELGDRFFDMANVYSRELRDVALECAKESRLTVHEGVYFFFPGPQYETPAEIRAARMLGGDAVGMSTVTEVITASHCRIPVLGMSFISNMASGVTKHELTSDEVVEAGEKAAPLLEEYFCEILRRLP